MTGQALYRRWRSQTFDQVIAQEHVTRTLQNAIRAGRIAHAYLFCGPRGTGKTSTARILAKAVNCLAEPEQRPCNACTRCQAVMEGRDLDLIEIDAASNRGIDEIRDLRDKIAFSPNEGRYKVYVIDEVHMLTTEAFNALLKTLEEPPPHVIFVLATTEPHKIPATVLSRCQRFDFRRIPLADLRQKLERICQEEQIHLHPEALEAIARRAAGSFRDAESLLDQIAALGEAEVTLEQVQNLLGTVGMAAVAELVDAWISADLGAGLRLINRLIDEGADARQLHLELVEYLRTLLLLQSGGDERLANIGGEQAARMRQQLARLNLGRLIDALRTFGQAESGTCGEARPQLPLEMAFAQAVLQATGHEERQMTLTVQPEAGVLHPPRSERPTARETGAGRPAGPSPIAEAQPRHEEPQVADSTPPVPDGDLSASLRGRWADVLEMVRSRDRMLQAVLRSVRPVQASGGRVLLEAEALFHRERLMEEKNRRLLEAVLEKLLGAPCRVECTVQDKQRPPATRSTSVPAPNAHPEVHEDPVVRYAVDDLGAQVSAIKPDTG